MLFPVLIIVHLLGASIWVGGHVVLLATVLPPAMRENSAARVIEFEKGYDRLGLGALAMQVVTGLWLAKLTVGDWRPSMGPPPTAVYLVGVKLVLLTTIVVLAGRAYHRVLPRIAEQGLKPFAVHAWVVSVLSGLMLVVGGLIRVGWSV